MDSGGQVVVGDAARLDHHQVGAARARAGHPGGDVARGPGDQVVLHERGVQGADLVAGAGDRRSSRVIGGHRWLPSGLGVSCSLASVAGEFRAARPGGEHPVAEGPQPVHDLVGAAAEVVVQPHVLGVQLVVDVGAGRVGRVHRVLLAAHGRGGGRHVGVGARRDRGVDGRAERGALAGGDDAERAPQHVRVDLHHERVLEQAAGHHELGDPAAGGGERVDDDPGAERGRFHQRPVDVRRPGGQGEAHDRAGQLDIDQHRAVPVEPVQGDQPVRAGGLARGLRRQQLEQGHAAPLGLVPVAGRDGVIEEPGEDVADPALPGLVAVLAGDDAAVHHPAHAGHLGERRRVHHVAGRGTHDGHHLTRGDGVGRGRGDVRVHVADGHGDAFGQPGPPGRLGGQPACPGPQRRDRVGQLVLGEAGEAGVQRAEEVR